MYASIDTLGPLYKSVCILVAIQGNLPLRGYSPWRWNVCSLPNWCVFYCFFLILHYPQNMDGPFYEQVRQYYSWYAEAELEFCSHVVQELHQLQRDAGVVRSGCLVNCAYCVVDNEHVQTGAFCLCMLSPSPLLHPIPPGVQRVCLELLLTQVPCVLWGVSVPVWALWSGPGVWVGRMLLHYIEPLVLESCTVQLQLHNHGNENLCHCLCKDCAIATSVDVINVRYLSQVTNTFFCGLSVWIIWGFHCCGMRTSRNRLQNTWRLHALLQPNRCQGLVNHNVWLNSAGH